MIKVFHTFVANPTVFDSGTNFDVAQVTVQVVYDVGLLASVEERQRGAIAPFGPYAGIRRVDRHGSDVGKKVNKKCQTYKRVTNVVPRRRQEGDVDAEGDHCEVDEDEPAGHLEGLRGPGPPVHPGGLGGHQLVPAAAAAHGRCAPQLWIEAVHFFTWALKPGGEIRDNARFNPDAHFHRFVSRYRSVIRAGASISVFSIIR